MTVLENLLEFWKTHRIVTIAFFYNASFFLYTIGISNLITQKICFPEGPPGTNVVCNVTSAFKEYNKMSTYRLTVRDILSGLMLLLGGSWRDQTGLSRPLVLMAILGEVIGCIMCLIASVFWSFSCWATVIVDSLSGIMGSRLLVSVACMAYVVDRATTQQRITRISVLVGFNLLGSSLANAVGGYILSALNYSWYFVLVMATYLSIVGLCLHAMQGEERRSEASRVSVASVFGGIKHVFKPRKNLLVSWLIILANLTYYCAVNGETAVSHSFLQKVLVLDPEKAGLLGSFRTFSSCIMSCLAAPILHDALKLSEFTISIICTIPSAVSCLCMAFVKTLLQAYIFYGIDLMRIALMSMMWSILMKTIKKHEIGIYSSCLTFAEAITPLITNSLYLFIMNQTIDYFPGAFYILSASLILISTCLLTISFYLFEEPEKNLESDSEN